MINFALCQTALPLFIWIERRTFPCKFLPKKFYEETTSELT